MPISTGRSRSSLIRQVAGDDDGHRFETGTGDYVEYPKGDELEPEDYFAYCNELWQEQDGALEPLHQSWVQNLLFLQNMQWFERDRISGKWQHRTGPAWRRWPVTNLVLPYYRNVLAKATKQKPASTAIPASLDPSDIHAARLAEDVLEAKWVELRMARTIRRFVSWAILTGNGYLYPFWNEETGKMEPLMQRIEVGVYEEGTHELVDQVEMDCPCDHDGQPFMREDGTYDVEREPLYRDIGDVGVRALNPFQVRVDPGAEEEEDVRWFIIAEAVPIRDLERSFPEFRGQFHSSDVGDLDRYDALISGAGLGPDTQVVAGQVDTGEQVPKAIIYHYHERPCDDYPEGRYFAVTEGVLLQEPGPLAEGIWPCLVHLKDLDIPGRYHGGCTMESVVGLNREYNEVNQQILEHHQLLLRGKWLVPIGSQIRRGTITQEPGEVIQHTPGLAPSQAELRPLPSAVYNERDRIQNDFQLVTGIHKVSLGEAPQGVTSGRAFLVLQEADDTDLGPFIAALELAVAEISWMILQIMQSRYDDERLVRSVGRDRSYRIQAFRGADLGGVADVVPQTGSAFPWSQAARQSAMIDLLTAVPDLFVDPETGQLDRARIQRELIVGGIETSFADADVDYNEVQREHARIEEIVVPPGIPPEEAQAAVMEAIPPIRPWQNHTYHLHQHARLLKSAEIEAWHPAARMALEMHYQQTVEMLGELELQRQEAQRQLAMQQAGSGGGPPPTPEEQEDAAIQQEEAAMDQMADAITRGEDPAAPPSPAE